MKPVIPDQILLSQRDVDQSWIPVHHEFQNRQRATFGDINKINIMTLFVENSEYITKLFPIPNRKIELQTKFITHSNWRIRRKIQRSSLLFRLRSCSKEQSCVVQILRRCFIRQ